MSYKFHSLILLFLAILGHSVILTEGAKIFFMIPLTSISEKNLYTPLIHELGQRGHQVTVATIKSTNSKSKNVKEIVPITYDEFLGGGDFTDVEASRKLGKMLMWNYDPQFNYDACHKVYQSPEFKAVISQQYDLVFTNYFCGHCFAGIIHQQGVPFIIFNSMSPVPYVYELSGYKIPTSIVPHPYIMSTDHMNFMERVENTLYDFYWTNFEKWSYIPKSEKIYRQYLGEALPGGVSIEKNVSLIFSNSHLVFNVPTPVMPDIVEIGGIQCRPPQALPKELKEFADAQKNGFIYFSLGSIVKGNSMPTEWRDKFIQAFSQLKVKVLWKWEGDESSLNLPPNVKIQKWLPQQDILGHPNCKLFMTHGGALSTQESLYHQVPVIGFPVFVDQDINIAGAERRGYGKKMELLDFTVESLVGTINEMLTNPKYTLKAKELSEIFKDQRETPLERAVYYTEYAIRHKGAHHLRSVGRDLTFVQYYLWDVFAFLFLILATLILTITLTLRFLYRSIFKGDKGSNGISKKRN